MFSLIICARKEDISRELRDNIAQTIGAEYEIIVINNESNQYNIFQAYNKGVSMSKFPFVLFMHDDIWYHTSDWGKKVSSYFEDSGVGAVGVAGTPYIPRLTGAWWSAGFGYLYLLQTMPNEPEPVLQNYAPDFSIPREVVALDGVWFCIRKSLFTQIRFDEENYQGFHFYDIDTTLQVYHLGYKLLCINDVLIHHQSIGVLNKQWLHYLFVFRKKWLNKLPISSIDAGFKKKSEGEYRVVNTFVSDKLRIVGDSKKNQQQASWFALKDLISYPRLFLYYKTPVWIFRLGLKYLKSLF